MKLGKFLCLFVTTSVLVSGCLGRPKNYTISGRVVNKAAPDESGVKGVLLLIQHGVKELGTVYTDADGEWSFVRINDTVKVTPSLEGYTFNPTSIKSINRPRNDIYFLALPINFTLNLQIQGAGTIEPGIGFADLKLCCLHLRHS
jgi:hypothetical protein